MRNRLAVMILLAGCSFEVSAAEKARVDVYLSRRDATEQFLERGKVLVSSIFEGIGVHLVWHNGELSVDRGTGCRAFAIHTAEHAPQSASSEALASTRLLAGNDTEILIYKDRLERLLAGHQTIANLAAAYVLAHELAHGMQGVARHSELGILKAYWSRSDYQDMVFHKLGFTPVDVDLIHRGLETRESEPAISALLASR